MPARTVHAKLSDRSFIVRKGPAGKGKWYREYPESTGKPAELITVAEAAEIAVADRGKAGARIVMGVVGGIGFDSKVKSLIKGLPVPG